MQHPFSHPAHRFLAMFFFLLSGLMYFVAISGLLIGSQGFFDIMMQLCMASVCTLLSVIYSVPEAEAEDDTLPMTKRSHMEIERMRGTRF